ncbi:SoxR reducing system RseC family protein [Thiocystis violacea]|uniref:SoxR reducing system RseC family protein n=1 Tax=Thiocystis violacea TaxID=13725 RepID=UPI00190600B6|nr:Fis family transcriptional regulator [Thiocystis violacea]
MIEEQGIVIAVSSGYARVRTQRQSACGHCEVSGACGTSLLERFFARRPVELTALNPVEAVVGDRVAVGISEQGLLKAAVAAYLVPVLALICGAVVGDAYGGDHREAMSLLGAVVGLVLALLWLRGYSVVSARNPGRRPRVLRRLAPNSITTPGPDVAPGVSDSL